LLCADHLDWTADYSTAHSRQKRSHWSLEQTLEYVRVLIGQHENEYSPISRSLDVSAKASADNETHGWKQSLWITSSAICVVAKAHHSDYAQFRTPCNHQVAEIRAVLKGKLPDVKQVKLAELYSIMRNSSGIRILPSTPLWLRLIQNAKQSSSCRNWGSFQR
jgi:hypothetical protein